MVSRFFFISKTAFSLIFSLTAQKNTDQCRHRSVKNKIVFMLHTQYMR